MSSSESYTDVVELCALLQCLGFSVKSLNSASDASISQAEPGTRTVVVNCQSSGLNVVLESPGNSCSCPTTDQHQNSGLWEVSGMAGGQQLAKEFGCSVLGSLPKLHRERLTKELHDIIRCIKQNNRTEPERVREDKSASLTELKSPEKRLLELKSEPPTRYRSLDALTAAKEAEQQLPLPRPLQRTHLISESSGDDGKLDTKRVMCSRQDTYTTMPTPSPPGSTRRRNKTSSPIQACQTRVLDNLIAAEKTAEELRKRLGIVINEYVDQYINDDSSMSSLALDVSKISIFKGAGSKHQFASSPNLSGIMATDDFTKSRIKRFESASTSNLVPKKEGKLSRQVRHITTNIFKRKEESPATKIEKPKTQDEKSKLSCLLKPRIVTPIRTNSPSTMTELSPNLSTSSKKKFSHVKSTIPRSTKTDK